MMDFGGGFLMVLKCAIVPLKPKQKPRSRPKSEKKPPSLTSSGHLSIDKVPGRGQGGGLISLLGPKIGSIWGINGDMAVLGSRRGQNGVFGGLTNVAKAR